MFRVTTNLIFKSGTETKLYSTFDTEEKAEADKEDLQKFLKRDFDIEFSKLSTKDNYGITRGNLDFYLITVDEVPESKVGNSTYEYTEK